MLDSNIFDECDLYDDDKLNKCMFACTKNLGGRPSKMVKYKKEREEILNKLLQMLGINETNNIFYLYDVERDDKLKQILDLKNSIEKYFTSKQAVVFQHNKKAIKPHTSLIRLVFKEMGYKYVTTRKGIERNGTKIHSAAYIVFNDN
jgi:hypothetical protein